MRYGSVCSGIEAATVAWEPLGWQAAWFAEIEKFPSAVLAERWPEVANLGDMTKIAAAVRAGEVEAPEVLVGGTPCQAFSIAGLRNGLDDERGQLTLSYVELADAIDDKRRASGEEEAIIVWENVPGVLSSKDNAFGCFLAGLAGEDSELQPAGGKWSNAGCVYGPSRIVAWRVLDAQFFGVAQRRRRVFVVASARSGFDPAKVLFEFEGVRRDTPPSREPQSAVAALTARGVGTCGADDNQAQAGHLIAQQAVGEISPTLRAGNAKDNSNPATHAEMLVMAYGGGNTSGNIDVAACLTAKGQRIDFDVETFAVHGTQDPDSNHELAHTLGRNHGQENAVIAFAENNQNEIRLQNGDGLICGPLSTGGGKPGQGYPAIAFSYKDHGADATVDMAPTLRAGNHNTSHANSGQPPAVASALSVRRLTPRECERLQGFPDDHTLIAWRGKDAADCPDGPRYRAIGNSMAVPVMRWIGERIAAALPVEQSAPRDWQRPFLKWAGGKYSLLPELDRLIPAGNRLIEPFVGGGSVFLNSDKHATFLLADVNSDLINLYQMLTVVPDLVTEWAQSFFEKLCDEDRYIECRDEFNQQRMAGPERAAAFLYLNRHCFNGLIRYNRDGQFNVGWGKKPHPYFPAAEIKAFASMAHNCVFMNAGYRRTLALAGEGDVVYCDPPYEPLPGTAGFTNYAAGGFSWDDQQDLARCCVAAHQRGATVLISNSTAPRVIELYERHGFDLHHVSARRAISSKGSTREIASDIVAVLGGDQ